MDSRTNRSRVTPSQEAERTLRVVERAKRYRELLSTATGQERVDILRRLKASADLDFMMGCIAGNFAAEQALDAEMARLG